jgi:hypothetical protein
MPQMAHVVRALLDGWQNWLGHGVSQYVLYGYRVIEHYRERAMVLDP